MAEPTVVVIPGSPIEAPPQGEPGPQSEQIDQATRFGEMLERQRQIEERLMSIEARIESGQADRAELASLRSEVARLTSLLEEVEEEIQEETPADVTLVTPEPEPIEPEPPPPPPKKTIGGILKEVFME